MAKLVKASGQYTAKDGTGHAIAYFKEDFIMDDAVQTKEQARSILHAGLMLQRLQEKSDLYPNVRRVRECQVDEFETVKQKAENSELEKLILQATQLECVPENISDYRRPEFKAKALQTAIDLALERKKKAKPDPMQDMGEVE